mgnify:CR=1 FL=1
MSNFRPKAREILETSTDQEVKEDAVEKMTELMEKYCKDLAERSSQMIESINGQELSGKDIEAASRTTKK